MSKRYQAAILTASYNGLKVPNAPTIGTATSGGLSASVTFTAPSNIGGGAITSYTAISSPGGITGVGASSPVTVSGLTSGVSYTFTVVANNVYGAGPASAASNSITAVDPSAFIENLFSTYLYTGNGSTQTITNGIDLSGKGGLVWVKKRNAAEDHVLTDTVRGAGNTLFSNLTDANEYDISRLSAFTSSGFSVGTSTRVNQSTNTYASWTFREQPKFFDVVTYTGTGTTMTVPHNLGSVPGCMIVKGLNSASAWDVYHQSLGPTQILRLSTTDAASTQPQWDNTAPTSTVFTVKGGETTNVSGRTYVAYLFAHDAGGFGATETENVISCGSYTESASAQDINLGYEPQWILLKRSSGASSWFMHDTMRGMSYTDLSYLEANTSAAEASFGGGYIKPTATGFIAEPGFFGNGSTVIYIAIRRGPMAVPTSGTSVYETVTSSASAGTVLTTGFPVDLQMQAFRSTTGAHRFMDRLRGVSTNSTAGSISLASTSDAAETSTGSYSLAWNNTGFQMTTAFESTSGVFWNFRRAPSFFDEVCYTGNSTAGRAINHNLGVAPELLIVKRRSGGVDSWYCYAQPLGNTYDLLLDSTRAASNADDVWYSTSPTSTTFTVRQYDAVNGSGYTYVAYLFATCAGVSKVGSYTGTGALQTVNCGFTGGARFVLIKRTDSTGDWYTYDSARGITSSNDPYLFLNSTAAEVTNTNYVDTDVTGFKITAAAPAGLNAAGGTYIFLAIA